MIPIIPMIPMLRSIRYSNNPLIQLISKTYQLNSTLKFKSFSSYSLTNIIDFDDESDTWPQSQWNTLLNICPQGKQIIIERSGKFHKLIDNGIFIAIPYIDQLKYVLDMRMKVMNIKYQTTMTKDNSQVLVSCVVYCRIVDPMKAAYSSMNPLYSMRQHTQSAIRVLISELELNQILDAKTNFGELLMEALKNTANELGLVVEKCDILQLQPDESVMQLINKYALEMKEREYLLLQAENKMKISQLETNASNLQNQLQGETLALRLKLEAEAAREAILIRVCYFIISF